MIAATLESCPATVVESFESLYAPTRARASSRGRFSSRCLASRSATKRAAGPHAPAGARALPKWARELDLDDLRRGDAVLLHELGHFVAAKRLGMRVERFSVFFPPLLLRRKVGETEYAVGAIPAGGYVKITGMSPDECAALPPELAARAYYNQPPWKRIVVILAGPGVNILIAFLLFWIVLYSGSLDGASALQNATPG